MEERGTQGMMMETGRPHAFEAPAAARRVGYVVAIIVNGIFLYLVHHLQAWGAPRITQEWALVLPAFDLSIGATMVANLLFVGYDARAFRRLAQIVLNLLGLRAMLTLYLVFPFAIEAARLAQWLRIGLVVVMAAIAIGTLAEVVQLLFGRD